MFLTALKRDQDPTGCKRTLLTVPARQTNTGFPYFAPDNKVLNNDGLPIQLEPGQATLTIGGRVVAAVNVLDHDGRPIGKILPVKDGQFTLDDARDKAIDSQVVIR